MIDFSTGFNAVLLHHLEKSRNASDSDGKATKEEMFSFLTVGRAMVNLMQQTVLLEKLSDMAKEEEEDLKTMLEEVDNDLVEFEKKAFPDKTIEEEIEEEEQDAVEEVEDDQAIVHSHEKVKIKSVEHEKKEKVDHEHHKQQQ